METILIIALAILAVVALIVWWMLDIDIPDIVATVGAPVVGVCIIYWYGTLISWVLGLLLLAIGAFALYYFLKRRGTHSPTDI